MAAERFHLAWFLGSGFGVGDWRGPWAGSDRHTWRRPDVFVDFARDLERACFDYVIIEDSSFVCDAWGGSMDLYLREAMTVPKQDPAVLATVLSQFTERIGIVPTLAVTEWPPFLLARYVASLDHISGGRAGWNVVTGSSDRAAQNYGHERQPAHDVRYDMADEMVDLVGRLWTSWESDAVEADPAGVYVDPAKVHTVDFEGDWFRSRGPLNVARPPQGRPVLVQAGGSSRGRQFAAGHADTIIASATSIEDMKAYRDDVRARMVAQGRKPEDCKVLFLLTPTLGATDAEAADRADRQRAAADAHPDHALAGLGFITDIDFSVYDLDAPLGELTATLKTNGHQSSLAMFLHEAGDRTLREVARRSHSWEPVGSPATVAAQMDAAMAEVGGDGFLFYLEQFDRRGWTEVTDGLVPELQHRGLVRTNYTHERFRDNLLEF
jgi:FMN-dependent oxidoreductase (nitrilotriacetate monooxygenase family)